MKKNLTLLLSLVIAANLVGCGRMYGGTYKGSVNYNPGASSGAGASSSGVALCQAQNATLTLNQQGNLINGTSSDQEVCLYGGGATLNLTLSSGTVNGDSISNVTAMATIGSMPCNFIGNITATGGWPSVQLNGTLTSPMCGTVTFLNMLKQ